MRDPRLTKFAKANRREMTPPERKLWHQIRAKRFQEIKFRRQHVLGRYIADFYSRDAKIVVEVDGDSHGFQHDYDRVREKYMHEMGLTVVRFTNEEVMQNMDGVLVRLMEVTTERKPPLPTSGASRTSPGDWSLHSPKGERA